MKIVITSLLSVLILASCGSNPSEVPSFEAEKDLSTDALSEAAIAKAGCAFVLKGHWVVACQETNTYAEAYAQRTSLIEYIWASDSSLDTVKNQNKWTRANISSKSLAAYSAVFEDMWNQFPFPHFKSEPAVKRDFYKLLLDIARDDRQLVIFSESGGSFLVLTRNRALSSSSVRQITEMSNRVLSSNGLSQQDRELMHNVLLNLMDPGAKK